MDWFKSWFNTPYYHILYNNHDYKEAEDFITALTQKLALPKNARLIDLACGKGRHSIFLNKIGYTVLGLDLSEESIAFDKQFENETLAFRVHDMRNEIFPNSTPEKVDAVFNLFTSFGYFEKETDDQKVFGSVKNVLKENGYFVLDYLNENFVRKNIVAKTSIIKNDILFLITKRIENNFIIKDITFNDRGKDFHYVEKVKLHSWEKMNQYAEKAGFEILKVWGDYQLNDFDKDNSPRCVQLYQAKNI